MLKATIHYPNREVTKEFESEIKMRNWAWINGFNSVHCSASGEINIYGDFRKLDDIGE